MNPKTINALNKLIEINNDRIEGYETASKGTNEVDLKLLFSQFVQTSKNCIDELRDEVHSLNGVVMEGTRIAGKFFRVWMDVKAAITGNDRKTILDSCLDGDDVALETYDNILKESVEDITAVQQATIFAQQTLLASDYAKLKGMRDMLVE